MAPALLRRFAPETPPAPATLARMRIALGTSLAIEATAQSEPAVRAAVEAAFAAAGDVETRMHPHGSGSDVARINAAPPGTRINIHASTWAVLRLARRLHTLSGGAFDPCTPFRSGRLEDLELGETTPWVIAHAPLALDLGGIAKGHAVDCAVEALREGGCSAGLVNAGGDLRVFGPRHAPILLRRSDGSCEPLELHDAALAVSEIDAPRRPPEHLGYYSRTGAAALCCRFAAVIAPEAALADALTKCVLLCPPEVLEQLVPALGPGVEVASACP
ncbi:MAG TPA: FAD:protein FMN transferase [Steroidobacteraceae bacterium]|nr:FAD:protein FMN transferase [Steroidobacteraceae bacterium]